MASLLLSDQLQDELLNPFYSELAQEGIILIVVIIALIFIKRDTYVLILILLGFLKLIIGLSIGDSYDPQCSMPNISCPAVIGWGKGPAYDVGLYTLLISLAGVKLITLTQNKWVKICTGIISIVLGLYAVYFFIKWWPIGYYNEMISDINYYTRAR